jgi:hypothetical protein
LAAAAAWQEADQAADAIEAFAAAHAAGVVKLDYRALGLPDTKFESIARLRQQRTQQRDAARAKIDVALFFALRRLQVALALDASPVPAAVADVDSYDLKDDPAAGADDKRAAMSALRSAQPQVETLTRHVVRQASVLSHAERYLKNTQFVGAAVAECRKMHHAVEALRDVLARTPYPYAPPGRPMSVVQYAFPDRTTEAEVGRTIEVASAGLQRLWSLYMRILADLAEQAERREAEIGLEPLSSTPFNAQN